MRGYVGDVLISWEFRTTMSTPSTPRSSAGARPAAKVGPGCRSRASTAWTATARTLLNYLVSQIATRPWSSSMRRMRPACSGRRGGGSLPASRAATMSSRCTPAERRSGRSAALSLRPEIVRDFLVNRARPFIFATAPSPLIAAITRVALEVSRTNPERRDRLARLVQFAGSELRRRCNIEPSGSHILPIIIGADQAAVAVAASLQRRGFDIRAIRPPTVAEGTARLRIALTANVDEAIVASLFEALAEDMRKAA